MENPKVTHGGFEMTLKRKMVMLNLSLNRQMIHQQIHTKKKKKTELSKTVKYPFHAGTL